MLKGEDRELGPHPLQSRVPQRARVVLARPAQLPRHAQRRQVVLRGQLVAVPRPGPDIAMCATIIQFSNLPLHFTCRRNERS